MLAEFVMTNPEEIRCPSCGCEAIIRSGWFVCPRCDQSLGPHTFSASGAEAMGPQTAIVTQYIRWDAIRQMVAYGASALFGIIAGLIIVFAPPNNQIVADLVAGAFVVLAAGVAGYTYVRAKTHSIDIVAGQTPTPVPRKPKGS
jgi:hypothetical protein